MEMVLIGIVATALLDLWTLARRRITGTPLPDYALVGRWFAHMPRGRFVHEAIGRAPPARHEAAIGWAAHYLVGIAFASGLVAIAGPEPTLCEALAFGTATVLAPFLLMQPAMGAGFAASRSPDPRAARLRSLAMHVAFGFCLYLAAFAVP